MADKYLELIEGEITEREVITQSRGYDDAGKLVGLGDDGRLDIFMMSKDVFTTLNPPPGGGGDVATDVIWDAKGDLAVGTGPDTAIKLSVGVDGKYLKAASGEVTGLLWDTPAGGAAHTIRENGVDQTARTGLNFIDTDAGAGLITDDAGGDETEVNLGLYRLESVDHSHQSAGAQGGKLDHGLALDGLSDPDHVVGALNFTATDKLAGRATAGAGAGEEIVCTAAARTILDDATVAAILTTIDGVAHSLATATNDFLVASGAGAFVKKTLAETQVILGATGLTHPQVMARSYWRF